MWLGQVPFKDFGMPVGYGFWIIPYLFFVIFGPYLVSLIKAQAFINIISMVVFRSTLKLFGLKESTIFFTILIFCLSFVLINFWPWYNHTVFVFELIALYFTLRYILKSRKFYNLIVSVLFIWLAVLTKQDGGGLSLMFVSVLLGAHLLYERDWKAIIYFAGSLLIIFVLLFVPFFHYDFGYWFNYGQEPHYSRISAYNFINDIFNGSDWIKGYLLLILILLFSRFKNIKSLIADKAFVYLTLLTIGILLQAMVIQVTSFSPPTVNLYFHSFAVAFILYFFQDKFQYNKLIVFVILTAALAFWQSQNPWKYSQKIFAKALPGLLNPPPDDVVSKGNWAPADTIKIEPVTWLNSDYQTLKNVKLPENTIEGINNLKELPFINKKDLHVLNMSNLTPLAYELNYTPEHGERHPLWYHKDVALFEREINMLCTEISQNKYDIILFEDMPDVDNFFPYDVRDCALKGSYRLYDKFLAPTGYITDSVEVYIKKQQ